MRLLCAKDFTKRKITLKEFNDDSTTPDYAILSHTWDLDEVKLRDLEGLSHKQLMQKHAYSKLENCCIKTLEWGLEWVWVDTCCIDQESSAELSEAINSMYQWYRQSAVCFAYLSDAYCREDNFAHDSIDNPDREQRVRMKSFRNARWFTRGWCLQELLAPRNMYFFNTDWEYIGSKRGLKTHISSVAGIDEYGLFIPDLSVLSVAHRMAWAASRQTTREEDVAYCLLGIFNINMPLLYGEGKVRAFGRLQEEIMRRTEDQSIFAWSGTGTDFRNDMVGFLAPDPAGFIHGRVDLCELPGYATQIEPLSITGRGIRAHIPLIQEQGPGENFLAVIGCHIFGSSQTYYAIPVTRLKKSSDIYRRKSPLLHTVSYQEAANANLSTIFLLRHSKPTHLEDKDTTQVWLSLLEMRRCFYKIAGTFPSPLWNVSRRVFAFSPLDFEAYPQMVIAFANTEGQVFFLRIDLNIFDGSCTYSLDEFTGLEEPAHYGNIEIEIDRQFFSKISGIKRLHECKSHLLLGEHSITATVERTVVFEQELYEVRISIHRV